MSTARISMKNIRIVESATYGHLAKQLVGSQLLGAPGLKKAMH